jgi:MFS family permease
MRPSITREIIDRRRPQLRWSAVFGGATVAVALWVLLQMLGMGIGMAAIDLDDAGSVRSVGIGTSVWTLVAPLLALFVGGIVAGRLSTAWDARSGATHGFVTWAIASIAGLMVTVSMVGMLTGGVHIATRGVMSDDVRVHPSLRTAEIQRATDRAGKMLLGSGISLLLGLGAAVGGGALGSRKLGTLPEGRRRTTKEVPVVPPPAEPPADAPHVTG